MRFGLACAIAVFVLLLAGCGGNKNGASSSTASTSAAAATTTAASNGEASKSGPQIIADTQKAIAAAKSVHIVGSGTSAGTKLTIDITYDTSAKGGGEGHLSINGLGFDIAHVAGKTYFRGDAKFLTQYTGAAGAKLLAGKWFFVSNAATGSFASLVQLTNLSTLAAAIIGTTATITKGAATTVDGQPAIALTKKGTAGELDIATTGPAYPLELSPGGKASGVIKFEDWDKPVTLPVPKNPLDFAKIVGKK
ncbi:MAG TPA: hypothetical protein VG265_14780 [Gaiellaceae bacterium]|jgi:hypothetical protein|nr:hypothetical protein [Gaiellaceae bacterium]